VSPAPDLVLVNGSVITVDEAATIARAVAVHDGRIAAVGTANEIRALAGERTRVIDLAGGAVLPGINDSHLHGAMLGAYWPGLWMDGLTKGEMPVPRELGTLADRRAALERAWQVLLPLGITSYTEPGLGPGADGQHGGSCGAATLTAYAEAEAAGELPIRVNVLLLFGELDGPGEPADLERGLKELTLPEADPHWLRVAGVKLFADGIPPMRTAWMSEPYTGGGHGELIIDGPDDATRLRKLHAMIDHAHQAGHQVGVHATGSAAVEATVSALKNKDHRHYVIHGDCVSAATLRMMAGSNIGLNTQPSLCEATAHLLEEAIGADRTAEAFPMRTALDTGVRLCLSSDAPVMAPDWRQGIAAAAGREGHHRITVMEAIRGYTIEPARQDHAEDWKGSIEVGKVADLCVLAADPLKMPAKDIPGIDVTMTIIDGRIRYRRGGPVAPCRES
jgi:predicted amidohydrolase YtcJ